ncbi:uncharacterized protein LOC126901958 isoform X2 [Daktulosphaira vitifoliae]|uniref:uncharacterized protein LOC126901958 isoform X2 n=1 Tax=Daktulosphaira vitifoliae TaxID=58002 RepID=UPI0021AA7E84|nr:uncharacterized protein LOC126901958 isoform X2 [Daktulosphaira vitifoliae]
MQQSYNGTRYGQDCNKNLEGCKDESWKRMCNVTSQTEHSPHPTWDNVCVDQLVWMFNIHAYGFACLFFILSFYAIFSILNIRAQTKNKKEKPFMAAINALLLVTGVSRAFVLFIDPYNTRRNISSVVTHLTWDLGLCSLVAALSLLQLSYIQLTQLQAGPSNMRSKSVVVTASILLVGLLVPAVITAALDYKLWVLGNAVRILVHIWGIWLCCFFLYLGVKVMTLVKRMPKSILQNFDARHKGIMQLGILAPYNNLATSMAAALVPALLVPHQKDSKDKPTVKITAPSEVANSFNRMNRRASSFVQRQKRSGSLLSPTTPSRRASEVTSIIQKRLSCVEGSKQFLALSPGNSAADEPEENSWRKSFAKSISWQFPKTGESDKETSPTASSSLLTPLQPQRSFRIKSSGAIDQETRPTTRHSSSFSDLSSEMTLSTILNHIAFVNRGSSQAGDAKTDNARRRASKVTVTKSEVVMVIRVVHVCAALAMLLCIFNFATEINLIGVYSHKRPWCWVILQTMIRSLELSLACMLANLTKQPVNVVHHTQYTHPLRAKLRGSFFI